MRNKIITGTAMIVIFIGILSLALIMSPDVERKLHLLPWKIEPLPDGGSRVFGITLGKDTVPSLQQQFNTDFQLAMFQGPGDRLALEAYFARIITVGLQARLIATLDAPDGLLQDWLANSTDREAQPSGSYRHHLSEVQYQQALTMPIIRLMYAPRADYDEKTVTQRFGDPERVEQINDTSRFWLYPSQGLIIQFDDEGREALYYTQPADFARFSQSLMSMTPAMP